MRHITRLSNYQTIIFSAIKISNVGLVNSRNYRTVEFFTAIKTFCCFLCADYKKTGRLMIPWAWMAIEYLQTGEFNIMSGTEEFA
jgi:hypothetical protein